VTPAQFVGLFAREKRDLLRSYLGAEETAVGAQIEAMNLAPPQRKALRAALDGVLTDAFYTVLLALDGAVSIGGKQVAYLATGREWQGADGRRDRGPRVGAVPRRRQLTEPHLI
jgi:hypothetical protein